MSLNERSLEFTKSLIKKSNISNPEIIHSAVIEINTRLEEFLILKLAEDLTPEDREDLFEMMEAFPKSFNLFDYFASKYDDLDIRVENLFSEFEKIYFKK